MDSRRQTAFKALDPDSIRAFAIACACRFVDIAISRTDVQVASDIRAALGSLDDHDRQLAAIRAQEHVMRLLPDDLGDLIHPDYVVTQAISVVDDALSAILTQDPTPFAISASDGALQLAAELDAYPQANAKPRVMTPDQASRMGLVERWEAEQQDRTITDLSRFVDKQLVIRDAQEAAHSRPT